MVLRIASVDGLQLGCEHHPPTGPERGVLLLSHAMMADSRSLDRPAGSGLASLLAERGYQVYRLDIRGHGLSPRSAWTYHDIYDKDLPAAVRSLRERHPELPLAVLGHSLTAHGGMMMLGRDPELPVDAFVGVAASFWLPQFEPSRLRWLIKRLLLEAWGLISKPLGYFPARGLRLGPANVSLGFVRDVLTAARRDRIETPSGENLLAGLGRVRCPVLLIAGEQDRLLAPSEYVRQLGGFLPPARLELWTVPGGHMSLVTSEQSRPTWRRLADWLDKTLVCT